jgi:hypothetical protein
MYIDVSRHRGVTRFPGQDKAQVISAFVASGKNRERIKQFLLLLAQTIFGEFIAP